MSRSLRSNAPSSDQDYDDIPINSDDIREMDNTPFPPALADLPSQSRTRTQNPYGVTASSSATYSPMIAGGGSSLDRNSSNRIPSVPELRQTGHTEPDPWNTTAPSQPQEQPLFAASDDEELGTALRNYEDAAVNLARAQSTLQRDEAEYERVTAEARRQRADAIFGASDDDEEQEPRLDWRRLLRRGNAQQGNNQIINDGDPPPARATNRSARNRRQLGEDAPAGPWENFRAGSIDLSGLETLAMQRGAERAAEQSVRAEGSNDFAIDLSGLETLARQRVAERAAEQSVRAEGSNNSAINPSGLDSLARQRAEERAAERRRVQFLGPAEQEAQRAQREDGRRARAAAMRPSGPAIRNNEPAPVPPANNGWLNNPISRMLGTIPAMLGGYPTGPGSAFGFGAAAPPVPGAGAGANQRPPRGGLGRGGAGAWGAEPVQPTIDQHMEQVRADVQLQQAYLTVLAGRHGFGLLDHHHHHHHNEPQAVEEAWTGVNFVGHRNPPVAPFTVDFDREANDAAVSPSSVIRLDLDDEAPFTEEKVKSKKTKMKQTLVCARCRLPLYTSEGMKDESQRVFALPCGHAVDAKCMEEMSRPPILVRAPDEIIGLDDEEGTVDGQLGNQAIGALNGNGNGSIDDGTGGRRTTRSSMKNPDPPAPTGQALKRKAPPLPAKSNKKKKGGKSKVEVVTYQWACPVGRRCGRMYGSKQLGGGWVPDPEAVVQMFI